MTGIEKKSFKNIETTKNPEETKEALVDLGYKIFESGKIERLPYIEEQELKYYSRNNQIEFDNFLKNNLPKNKLEIA